MKNNTFHGGFSSAFTLIETLIAMTLLTVVLTAVTGLILTTLLSNQRNLHSLQALYLAEEGLEAVRYMRDSNWLQNYSWDGGSALWNANFDVSGGTSLELFLKEGACPPCFSFTIDPLESEIAMGNGFTFTRLIRFAPVPDEADPAQFKSDTAEVTATVSWEDRGVDREIKLSTYLSNWQ